MARIKITILKDTDRYFGDVQREARKITGKYLNIARKKNKKAKPIHPEKAIRLAKKEVASVDSIQVINISDDASNELTKKDMISIGYDIAMGRRFNAELEN